MKNPSAKSLEVDLSDDRTRVDLNTVDYGDGKEVLGVFVREKKGFFAKKYPRLYIPCSGASSLQNVTYQLRNMIDTTHALPAVCSMTTFR